MGETFELNRTTAALKETPPAVRRPSALVDGYEAELDEMRARVSQLPNEDPADVLATLSGIAGRLAEIRAQLHRDNSQRCTQLRAREVDPLRDDLELQFKIHSRRIALMEWELRLSGGGV